MNECIRCGTRTTSGEVYRFQYGAMIDNPGELRFQRQGEGEAFVCDRCLVRAELREEAFRGGLYLAISLLAIAAVASLVMVFNPAAWVAAMLLLIVLALGAGALMRFRNWRIALRRNDEQGLRELVRNNQKLQSRGDEWAIDHRRPELQDTVETENGMVVFLTRADAELWTGPTNDDRLQR